MCWLGSLVFSFVVWAMGMVVALSLISDGVWLFLAGGLFTTIIYEPLTRYADRRWFHVEHSEENPDVGH